MIKLIASDVDGTLLRNGAIALEPEVFDLIRQCRAQGMLFVVASGRQYPSLRRVFEPVWEDLIFAAENGALIVHKDEILHKLVWPRSLADELIADIAAQPGCHAMVSSPFTSWVLPQNRENARFLAENLSITYREVENFSQVDEDVIKVAALVEHPHMPQAQRYFGPKWSDRLMVAVSGERWVDFGLSGKGAAVRRLRDMYGFSKEECMAFGDNFNDEEMFRSVGHPFAMTSAHSSLQEMCGNTCDTVEEVLRKLLENSNQPLPPYASEAQ